MKNDNQATIQSMEEVVALSTKGFTVAEPVKPFTKIDNIFLGNEGEPGLLFYLGEAEVKLILAISRFTTGYQDRAYWQASQETVAQQTNMGRKAVMRAAESLGDKGKKLITVSRSKGVTMWRINFENIAPFMLKMSPKDSSESTIGRVPKTQSMSPKDSINESQRLHHGVFETRPSNIERKKENIETNKENFAPQNGAGLRDDFLAHSAAQGKTEQSPQMIEAEFWAELQKLNQAQMVEENHEIQGNDSESNNLDIQAVVTAPPCSAAPPQADKPKGARGKTTKGATKKSQAKHANPEIANDVVWSMAEGCKLIVTAMENGEPVLDAQGQAKQVITKRGQLDKVGATLRDLGVSLDEVRRMTTWFQVYEDPAYFSPNPDKYLAKLALFREFEASQGCEAIQAMKTAIKAIYGQSEAKLSAKIESALSQVALDLIAAGRNVAWVTAFPEIWRNEYQDCGLPKSTNLISFVHLEPKNSTQNTSSEWAEGEFEEWLKGTTVGA